jgi:signal transduction histidine kinase
VRNSIVDRMARHGGSADVRSAPGEGTEVRLHMPRTGQHAHPHDQTHDEPHDPEETR